MPLSGAGEATPRGRHLGIPGPAFACKILVTGAAGFICGYLIEELLHGARGHRARQLQQVWSGIQELRPNPNYRFVEGDAKDRGLLTDLASDADQVVAAAAMIGGISYFHEFAYDLLAENERILASTFDASVEAHKSGRLQRIVVMSSSMVFESAMVFPTPEGAQLASPPGQHLRLSEALRRVLRERRFRAVRTALHDPSALQLRRHWRTTCPAGLPCHDRERATCTLPCRA